MRAGSMLVPSSTFEREQFRQTGNIGGERPWTFDGQTLFGPIANLKTEHTAVEINNLQALLSEPSADPLKNPKSN